MLPSPLYTKLPKWVQADIRNLERKIEHLTEENELLRGSAPESNTPVLLDHPKKFYLEDYARVHFKGHHGLEVVVSAHPDGFVRVDIEDGCIVPYARNNVYIVDRHNKINR